MPGVYREKECPTCGVKHRKKGKFCSKSCSNKGRDPEVYQKHSEFMKNSETGKEVYHAMTYDPKKDPAINAGGSGSNKPDGFVSGGVLWTSD